MGYCVNLVCGVPKVEGSYNAKLNQGPWSDACIKVLFFLPVEVPIVWHTGFLGHTVCLDL